MGSWRSPPSGAGHPPPSPLGLAGRPGMLPGPGLQALNVSGGGRAPNAQQLLLEVPSKGKGGRAAGQPERGTKGTLRSHLPPHRRSECSPCAFCGRPEASDARLGEGREDGEATGSSVTVPRRGRPPQQRPPMEDAGQNPACSWKFWSCWGKGVASGARGGSQLIVKATPLCTLPQWAWPLSGAGL